MLPAAALLAPLVFATLKLTEGEICVLTLETLFDKLLSVAPGPAAIDAVLVTKPLKMLGKPRKLKTICPPLGIVRVAVMLLVELTKLPTLAPALKVVVIGPNKFTPEVISVNSAFTALSGPRFATVTV